MNISDDEFIAECAFAKVVETDDGAALLIAGEVIRISGPFLEEGKPGYKRDYAKLIAAALRGSSAAWGGGAEAAIGSPTPTATAASNAPSEQATSEGWQELTGFYVPVYVATGRGKNKKWEQSGTEFVPITDEMRRQAQAINETHRILARGQYQQALTEQLAAAQASQSRNIPPQSVQTVGLCQNIGKQGENP